MALSQQAIVAITDAATNKLKETLAASDGKRGIRLGVVGGGCAGLQYDMQPVDSSQDGDFIQEVDEQLTLFIHPVAAAYLKGTTVDFSHDLMDGGFKFINPNATSTCGCGTSFGV